MAGAGGAAAPEEFVRALDGYLRVERVRIRELWAAAGGGAGGEGALGAAELGALVHEVLPQAHPAAAGLLQALADGDGDGQVSLDEFAALVRRTGELTRGGTPVGLLQQVAAAFEKDLLWARQAFNDNDQDEDGFLEIHELPGLLRDVIPALPAEDSQRVLLHVYGESPNDDKRVTLSELKQVLGVHAASNPRTRDAAEAPPALGPWRLRRQIIAGKKYIVDPASGKVFLPQAEGSRRLTFVGVVEEGKLQRADSCAKLFDTIDVYLSVNKLSLQDLWREHDASGQGLDPRQIGSLLRGVMPSITAKQARYFATMVDVDGDGRVTLEEMLQSIKQCKGLGVDLVKQESFGIEDILFKLSGAVADGQVSLWEVFRRFDANGSGELDRAEVAALARAVVPALSRKEIRHILAHTQQLDSDGDGKLSYAELMKALQLVSTEISTTDEYRRFEEDEARERELESERERRRLQGAQSSPRVQRAAVSPAKPEEAARLRRTPLRPPRAPRVAPQVEWDLERVTHEGRDLLLERSTGRLFRQDKASGAIEAVGRYRGSTVEPPARLDLFGALDRHLKEHNVRLKALFEQFGGTSAGGAVALGREGLVRLVRRLLPQASETQARYFGAMMDLDGDGQVTVEELLRTVKAFRDKGASLVAPAQGEASAELQAVLEKLRAALRDERVSLWDAFCHFDRDSSGELELPELVALVRAVAPGLDTEEQRRVCFHLEALDVDGNGALSYPELMRALQLVNAKISTTDGYRRLEEDEARERELESERERRRLQGAQSSPRVQRAAVSPAKPEEAARLRRTPLRPPRAPRVAPQVEWDLERVTHEGRDLLLERSTGRLFRQDKASGAIEAVGRYRGSTVEPPARLDLFGALDRHLKEHNVRLKALFEQFGGTSAGGAVALGREGLVRLVRRLLPQASETQARYFGAMMDLDGDGQVTVEELLRTVKAFRDKGASLVAPAQGEASAELQAVLEKLRAALRDERVSLWDAFCHFDRDSSGELELPELVALVRAVAPGLDTEEQRRVCFHLEALDVDGNGALSYPEVTQALNICEPFISASHRALPAAPPKRKIALPAAPSLPRMPEKRTSSKAQAARRAAAQKKREEVAAAAAKALAEEEAMNPGAAARRRMDRCNGARAHILRVQPKHIVRRHELMAALQRGVEEQQQLAATREGF